MSILLSIETAPFYVTAEVYKGFNFSVSSPTFAVLLLFDNSHPTKCEVISHLIFISLMISDTEHSFIYVLAVCISSLEKCLFKFLPVF